MAAGVASTAAAVNAQASISLLRIEPGLLFMADSPCEVGVSIPHTDKSILKSFVIEPLSVRPLQARPPPIFSSTLGRGFATTVLALARFQQGLQVRDGLLVADGLGFGCARLRRFAGGGMRSRSGLTGQLDGTTQQPVIAETRTRNVRRRTPLGGAGASGGNGLGRGFHRRRTRRRL